MINEERQWKASEAAKKIIIVEAMVRRNNFLYVSDQIEIPRQLEISDITEKHESKAVWLISEARLGQEIISAEALVSIRF